MEALRRSVGQEQTAKTSKTKKPKKTTSGQKEMLLPIAGKKAAKEATAKKPAAASKKISIDAQ
jgi:DNA end-binding protein Ku